MQVAWTKGSHDKQLPKSPRTALEMNDRWNRCRWRDEAANNGKDGIKARDGTA